MRTNRIVRSKQDDEFWIFASYADIEWTAKSPDLLQRRADRATPAHLPREAGVFNLDTARSASTEDSA